MTQFFLMTLLRFIRGRLFEPSTWAGVAGLGYGLLSYVDVDTSGMMASLVETGSPAAIGAALVLSIILRERGENDD